MDDLSDRDFIWQYDMIKTLFGLSDEEEQMRQKRKQQEEARQEEEEEEEEEEEQPCECEQGIASRVFSFLFGHSHSSRDDPESLIEQSRGNRPFHTHIQEPPPRKRRKGSQKKEVQWTNDSSYSHSHSQSTLVTRPTIVLEDPLHDPLGPGANTHTCESMVKLVAAFLLGALFTLLTVTAGYTNTLKNLLWH